MAASLFSPLDGDTNPRSWCPTSLISDVHRGHPKSQVEKWKNFGRDPGTPSWTWHSMVVVIAKGSAMKIGSRPIPLLMVLPLQARFIPELVLIPAACVLRHFAPTPKSLRIGKMAIQTAIFCSWLTTKHLQESLNSFFFAIKYILGVSPAHLTVESEGL